MLRTISRRALKTLLVMGALTLVSVSAMIALISAQPSLAAQGADVLRDLIGNEPVAQLESIVFTAHDTMQQREYDLGMEKPAAPWSAADALPNLTPMPTFTATSIAANPQRASDSAPAPARLPSAWQLSPVTHLGTLQGEGIWSPYLRSRFGQAIAYRTFLQPDPARPYSLIAVVAFDLSQTRLHYVLGSEEPSVSGGPKGTGKIAADDRDNGSLLAAFNGGFKATHGHFGAMQNGLVALPALNGFAAVALYDDGRVRIGEWGKDILPSKNIVAWRENARLIIQNGQVSPRVAVDALSDWGGTISGSVVTWRSALGLGVDNRVLYYFAGPNLSMPTLARAMLAAGVQQGLLLDINASWVHFTAIRDVSGKLSADPLLPDMKSSVDRYLRTSQRDFFYITSP